MATDPKDLTTVASLTAYAQGQIGSDPASQALAQTILTGVSYKIQLIAGKNFAKASYIEIQNTFQRQLRGIVKNNPLISIESLRWGYANCLQINYTGTASASAACITEADPVSGLQYLNLTTIDSFGSHLTQIPISPISLDPTAVQTTAGLVTAINGVTDFTASISNGYNVPTRWLYPMMIPLKTANNTYIGYVGYPYVDVFNYQFNKNGTFGYSLMGSFDYFFDSASAASYQLHFPGLYQGLMVDYTAGYSVIPPDIQLLANELSLQQYLLGASNVNLASERMDQYAYQMADTMALDTDYINKKLFPYKSIPLSGGLS